MNRNICSFREFKSQRIEDKANWGKRYRYTAMKTTNLNFKRFSGEQDFLSPFLFPKGSKKFVRKNNCREARSRNPCCSCCIKILPSWR